MNQAKKRRAEKLSGRTVLDRRNKVSAFSSFNVQSFCHTQHLQHPTTSASKQRKPSLEHNLPTEGFQPRPTNCNTPVKKPENANKRFHGDFSKQRRSCAKTEVPENLPPLAPTL